MVCCNLWIHDIIGTFSCITIMNSLYGFQKRLYKTLLILLSVGVITLFSLNLFSIKVETILHAFCPVCVFREYSGIYCPGCGGIRSTLFLLNGDILQSLFYHPFVVYTILVIGVFLIFYTIYLITGKVCLWTVFHPIYLYIGMGIIIVQWLIKLIFLIFFGVEIIP